MLTCYRTGAWQQCLLLFHGMCSQQISPGAAEHACALRACGCGGNWRAAAELLAAWQRYGVVEGREPLAWPAVAWAWEASGMPVPWARSGLSTAVPVEGAHPCMAGLLTLRGPR